MTDAQDPKSPQQPNKSESDTSRSATPPQTPAATDAGATPASPSPASSDYVESGTQAAPRPTGKPVAGTAEGSGGMPPNPDTLTRPPHATDASASADAQAETPQPAHPTAPAVHPSAAQVASDRNPIGAPAPKSIEDVKAAGGEPPHQPTFGAGAARPGSPSSMGGQPSYLQAGDSPWSVLRRITSARFRAWYDRAGQRITQRTLKIGISARIFHPEPGSKGLRSKTLQYLEESIAHWVMSRDVLVFMIPTVDTQGLLHPSHIRLHDYAKHLDGLVLQGGADVSPLTYSEVATRHEWQGDRMRDMYELELLHEFVEQGKPILGVCRGCQLINVAFGGTLHQDIATDLPDAIPHVTETYEHNRHTLTFPEGSSLAQMLGPVDMPIVNSIHHQSVRTLGRDLSVEAMCAEDGVVEAIRYRKAPFVMGLQWHPEFHRAGGPEFLDCTPVLDNFLRAARETRF
ncbi:gamma-glutamyl-gamma-aminobutyrate hydrolase family protein [Pandoraea communis]|uniref:gamma-glutamyl-gamma-aminobutyrate hydrolase family protein n=1 Tax=Pandoraea communis TaxID=2508297 RepID=UPI0025A6213E|nr:gamma-glutamyl-gamma-aminobutyrate hydrolase family protein [Pandoraea communis]MDM8357980.1 gamma-glutamyl-gamma-aminobutyrate hydrolase family protein [Pandoraea communis]